MTKNLCKLRSYCFVFFLVIVSALLYMGSLMVSSSIGALLRGLAALVLGAALIDGILTVRFQINMENQIGVLNGSIKRLQDTVAIASGAVESGLTAVYSERRECLEEINTKLHQLIDDSKAVGDKAPKIEIRMLGISLGDFLCPHGLLQPTFRELLKLSNFVLEIIILKDRCNAAYRRALREEEGKFSSEEQKTIEKLFDASVKIPKDSYEKTKCHDELKTATDYLHDLIIRKTLDRDQPNKDNVVKATLKVYEYDSDPMTFLFIVDDDMFIENYHLAGRGGEAPILRVTKLKRQSISERSRLYEIYSGHFEAMKKISEEIEPTSMPPDNRKKPSESEKK